MRSVIVSLVFALRSAARSRAALHLESLALRYQLAVLNRSRPPRLRLTAADRMLWAWLSQAWSGWRPALILVKPDTAVRQNQSRCAASTTFAGAADLVVAAHALIVRASAA